MLRRALIPLVLLAATAIPAAPADAYEFAGEKWPGGRVTYYVAATQHQTAISRAVRAWNASGARVRFSRTRSRRRANLVITYRGTADFACREGQATVGRDRRARLFLPRLTAPNPFGDLVCLRTMVHELGHVLGLSHEDDRCAVMNSVGVNLAPEHCERHEPWEWRCRLIEPDDVAGAIRRYGGRRAAPREPAECDLYAPAPPLTDLTGAFDPRIRAIPVTFRRPAVSPVPTWLRDVVAPPGGPPGAYAIAAARDVCPAAPPMPPFGYESPPGELERHQVGIDGPGRWCVAAWHVDELGRAGSAPATLFVDVG